MNLEQLQTISDALNISRDNARMEATLLEMRKKRELHVTYLRDCLIPEIDKAYKIVETEYINIK